METIRTIQTQLTNHGLPMEAVSTLLGHKTINKTQHYARIYGATVRQQFETTAAALEGILVQDWPIAKWRIVFIGKQRDNSRILRLHIQQ